MAMRRVSQSSSTGGEADGGSYYATISNDGRYVVFESAATNLHANDDDGFSDSYLWDAQTGTLTLLTTGIVENASLSDAMITADGQTVIFRGNIVFGSPTGSAILPLSTGSPVEFLVREALSDGNDGDVVPGVFTSVSANGNFVVFADGRDNLVDGDTNGQADIFLYDRANQLLQRVSVSSSQAEAGGASDSAFLSADGRFVVFTSDASDLVAADTNGTLDVFLRDTLNGTTERISIGNGGVEGNAFSNHDNFSMPFGNTVISDDGRHVVFVSGASNFAGTDNNGTYDVFIRDRVDGTTTLVSRSVADAYAAANAGSRDVSMSADGRFVVFASEASDLVADDTNNAIDVFIFDRTTGEVRRLSVPDGGGEATGGTFGSYSPRISADGGYVVFESDATNLVTGDTNGTTDIFIVENPFIEAENQAPQFVDDADPTIEENTTEVRTFAVTDAEGETPGDGLTFSIVGGADFELFTIDQFTGSLSFVAAPDFETPQDADQDNIYVVTVRVTDSGGLFSDRVVGVTVTDVDEGGGGVELVLPEGIAAFDENTAADTNTPTGTVLGTIAGLVDAVSVSSDDARFDVVFNDGSGQWELVLIDPAALDFEATDAGSLLVTITVTDSLGGQSQHPIAVPIGDVNEAPSSVGLTYTSGSGIAEGAATGMVVGALSAIDPDGNLGSSPTTYVLVNSAGGRFAIADNGSGGFDLVVDNGVLLDFERNTAHNVVVRVTDQAGAFADHSITVQVLDVEPENLGGNDAANIIYGGAGNDRLSGGGGNDRIYGGGGADRLFGDAGNDRLYGEDGNDFLYGGDGNDYAYGGAGNDRVYGNAGNDFLYGEDGNDNLYGGDGIDTIFGGAGIDTIYGDAGNDVLRGGDGNDSIYGGLGDDRIYGEDGDDQLFGNDGRDTMWGGNGRDRLLGGAGDDALYGEAGRDAIRGEDGNDRLYGGADADWLYGGRGNDTLYGDDGDDELRGEDGNDILYGGTGNDWMTGGNGNDTLRGENGNEKMWGEAGDDILIGGLGRDVMYGGTGRDQFRFDAIAEIGNGATRDYIHDFTIGEDRIDLRQIDANGAGPGNAAFTLLAGAGTVFGGIAGQLRFYHLGGNRTIVEGDIDGDRVSDFQLELGGIRNLTSVDFFL